MKSDIGNAKFNDSGIEFTLVRPDTLLSGFVESFWSLRNASDSHQEMIVLPDGRVELTFSKSAIETFHITLSGIETKPERVWLPPQTHTFGISFKLPAIEPVFQISIANLLNYATHLPDGFWKFTTGDVQDFDLFCNKASQKIFSLLPQETDSRKEKLFDLMYSSKGSVTVTELSKQVYWSSRQMNRYFNQQFGLSVKAYCNILRFRASLEHIAQGKFFPEQSFADQSHFIREIKKFSGVSPKQLKRNHNDRFIQFSAMTSK